MRTVKHPDLVKKNHRNPASFALTDLCPQLDKQCLNVTPLDIGAYGTGKNSLKGFLVLSFHARMVPDLGTM